MQLIPATETLKLDNLIKQCSVNVFLKQLRVSNRFNTTSVIM